MLPRPLRSSSNPAPRATAGERGRTFVILDFPAFHAGLLGTPGLVLRQGEEGLLRLALGNLDDRGHKLHQKILQLQWGGDNTHASARADQAGGRCEGEQERVGGQGKGGGGILYV